MSLDQNRAADRIGPHLVENRFGSSRVQPLHRLNVSRAQCPQAFHVSQPLAVDVDNHDLGASAASNRAYGWIS